jgi:hypothetical protein
MIKVCIRRSFKYYCDGLSHRYADFTGNTETNRETLFTEEEWLDILTKSRLSYEMAENEEQGLRNIK